jgi:hypothetical protein
MYNIVFLTLELIGFYLPAIVFTITKSQAALYGILTVYFLAHVFGGPTRYKMLKRTYYT